MVGGSRRWFDLGAFHLQPSELMKVLTIIALAKYVHETPALDGRTLRHILVPIFLAGLPFLLIAAQPDLGTALIIVLIFATVMLTARLRLKTMAGIAFVVALAAAPCGNTPCTTISATASWPSSTQRSTRPLRGNRAKP
jgi:rod shape determining protein RodA